MRCQMDQVSRPVFVVGTHFSGNNLLSWALSQHPDLIHVLETDWLVKLAGDLELLYETATNRTDSSHLVAMSVTRSRFCEIFGNAVNELLLANSWRSSSAPPRRWVNCTAAHGTNIAALLRLFPQAKFIHTIRDVDSVAKCLVDWPGPDGTSPYNEESAYDYWLTTTKALLEAEMAFGSDRIMRVSFASLLKDTENALRCCLSFLHEPFSSGCLRPFTGLDSIGAEAPQRSMEIRTRSQTRDEAELLSGLLNQVPRSSFGPDPERIERLDAAFSENGRPRVSDGTILSLTERIKEVARSFLPADARTVVVSKGDDALVRLGDRKAGHFPQNEDGVYAGFHPGDGYEAISHLEALRKKGYDFLLIPNPQFWWLQFYGEFNEHLHARYRIAFYQEDTCLIFDLRDQQEAGGTNLKVMCESKVQV